MKISALKEEFKKGGIDKPSYIRLMLAEHQSLYEYSNLLGKTNIAKIEIIGDAVIFHFRDMLFCMVAPSNEARVAPIEILNFDQYEAAEVRGLSPLLDGVTSVLDVGANIGWFSLWFAHRLPNAKVHAFEPMPLSYDYLSKNVGLNNLQDRITTHRLCLSDSDRDVQLYAYPTGNTNVSLRNVSGATDAVPINVSAQTLDSWIAGAEVAVDLIKCDVEGAELLVFRGARETIANQKPIVFTEMLRKWSLPFGYHPNETIKFFSQLGYVCFSISDIGLRRFFEMTDDSVESTFVFLHLEKHAAQFTRIEMSNG